MAGANRRKKKEPTGKKFCNGKDCKKERPVSKFYKVKSPMFPDGMINICSDCVRKEVDIDNIDSVISFLRQIDKPFVQKQWETAVASGRYPLGEYIRKVNSLKQVSNDNFNDSDGMNGKATGANKVDLSSAVVDHVFNEKGEVIVYSEELVNKWGTGYTQEEYLTMEKFYQDMRITHDITSPVHIQKLKNLAYDNVLLKRLREKEDVPNYTKLAQAIDKTEQSAGFRPIDRKGIDDATGIRSFAQVWEEVEKNGFRLPPVEMVERDVYDGMIISLGNYYHRLVGKKILSEIPEELRRDADKFYELDETPVELNDEDYEDLDFTVDDDDYSPDDINELVDDIDDVEEEEEKEEKDKKVADKDAKE